MGLKRLTRTQARGGAFEEAECWQVQEEAAASTSAFVGDLVAAPVAAVAVEAVVWEEITALLLLCP